MTELRTSMWPRDIGRFVRILLPLSVGFAVAVCVLVLARRLYRPQNAQRIPSAEAIWHSGGVPTRSNGDAEIVPCSEIKEEYLDACLEMLSTSSIVKIGHDQALMYSMGAPESSSMERRAYLVRGLRPDRGSHPVTVLHVSDGYLEVTCVADTYDDLSSIRRSPVVVHLKWEVTNVYVGVEVLCHRSR